MPPLHKPRRRFRSTGTGASRAARIRRPAAPRRPQEVLPPVGRFPDPPPPAATRLPGARPSRCLPGLPPAGRARSRRPGGPPARPPGPHQPGGPRRARGERRMDGSPFPCRPADLCGGSSHCPPFAVRPAPIRRQRLRPGAVPPPSVPPCSRDGRRFGDGACPHGPAPAFRPWGGRPCPRPVAPAALRRAPGPPRAARPQSCSSVWHHTPFRLWYKTVTGPAQSGQAGRPPPRARGATPRPPASLKAAAHCRRVCSDPGRPAGPKGGGRSQRGAPFPKRPVPSWAGGLPVCRGNGRWRGGSVPGAIGATRQPACQQPPPPPPGVSTGIGAKPPDHYRCFRAACWAPDGPRAKTPVSLWCITRNTP